MFYFYFIFFLSSDCCLYYIDDDNPENTLYRVVMYRYHTRNILTLRINLNQNKKKFAGHGFKEKCAKKKPD